MEHGRWQLLGSITGRAERLLIPLFSVTLNFPSYRDREVVVFICIIIGGRTCLTLSVFYQ